MLKRPFAALASLVFVVVCLLHVARLGFRVGVVAGGWEVPMWMSVVGAIGSGVLGVLLWREAQRP